MPVPVLGTAHLFGLVADNASDALLGAAWDAGFRAFDTAPLYGHGRSEVAVGLRLGRWPERPRVTSKVGLAPSPPDARGRRVAKSLVRRLPGSVRERLRAGDGHGPRGDFDPVTVRLSVENTLRRLGHVDRLMLHEAHAEDLTDEALAVLAAFRDRGDVGQLGIATANAATARAVGRAPELLTAVHLEVGPFAEAVDLPPGVTTVIGHGVLGPGGSGLRRLVGWSAGDDPTAVRWRSMSEDTRWTGTAGLADILVARAAALPLIDVIVATSRADRLPGLRDLVARAERPPVPVTAALDAMIAAARLAR